METWNDPIVDEVRDARQAYAAEFQHDLAAICADLRRQQAIHPERLVSLAPKLLADLPAAA